MLGAKLSIVSPRPQTTREAILGILNSAESQIIFLDTPGWLKPSDPFQSSMKRAILRSLHDDADVIIWVVEPRSVSIEEEDFAHKLTATGKPICVVINKIDAIPAQLKISDLTKSFQTLFGLSVPIVPVSAKTGQGISNLISTLLTQLPAAPPYFPTDQLTNRWERFYVAELIREQIFQRYQQEVPHASAVLVEDFIEKEGRKDVIQVSIIVETEGQMRIILGDKGRSIKELGQASRQEIEARLGRPVYLELKVKIRKNWRKDNEFIKSIENINL